MRRKNEFRKQRAMRADSDAPLTLLISIPKELWQAAEVFELGELKQRLIHCMYFLKVACIVFSQLILNFFSVGWVDITDVMATGQLFYSKVVGAAVAGFILACACSGPYIDIIHFWCTFILHYYCRDLN